MSLSAAKKNNKGCLLKKQPLKVFRTNYLLLPPPPPVLLEGAADRVEAPDE
jgi:hypothetical protein